MIHMYRFVGGVSDIARRIRLENEGDCVAYHAPRYAMLLILISNYVATSNLKVLDIGRSKFTDMMGKVFSIRVDSLGFELDHRTGTGDHYQFDLNDAQYPDRWRGNMPRYDIIVMAEVIEHLHTSPSLVLSFIKRLMKPNGVLVIQTPNASVLHKCIILLLGWNPYELIREDIANPGHFREYTPDELKAYAEKNGFIVERSLYGNHFDYRYRNGGGSAKPKGYLANLLYSIVPKSMKPGITIVLRLPEPKEPIPADDLR